MGYLSLPAGALPGACGNGGCVMGYNGPKSSSVTFRPGIHIRLNCNCIHAARRFRELQAIKQKLSGSPHGPLPAVAEGAYHKP